MAAQSRAPETGIMSVSFLKRSAGVTARWLGRALGSLAIALVGMLLFADPPSLTHLNSAVTGQLLMLGLAVLGVIVGWKKELLGGSAILAGLVGFCIVQILVNGRLPGGQLVPFWSILGICPIVADGLAPLPGSPRSSNSTETAGKMATATATGPASATATANNRSQ